jgi:hypothetical protein
MLSLSCLVLSVVVESHCGCELAAECGELIVLACGGLVAGEGPAVGAEVVRLGEFPDLVSERVLEGIAVLFS